MTGSAVAGSVVPVVAGLSGVAAFCRSDLISLPIWRSGFIASLSALAGLRLCASLIVFRTSSRSASRNASSNC
ncbi:hypothetical protein D9M70_621940 [compost metagenome]